MNRIITITILIFLLFWSLSIPSGGIKKADNVTPTPTLTIIQSKFKPGSIIDKKIPAPDVSAKNIFIIDQGSGQVLYSKSPDDRIYPASTTKMMTALVAKEVYSPNQLLTVSKSYPEGQDIGLTPNEKVSIENLLYALLVLSANDAAEVIADNYQGGRAEFVSKMNSKAEALHLQNTHFKNPTGFDEEGHYSSAADLARIAKDLMADDYLRRIVSTEKAVLTSADGSIVYPIENVNQLLGKVPGVLGVKTGWTDLAGESLVTYISRDGHEIIISLMGSANRFADTTNLINWTYSNFVWSSSY